MRPIPGTRRTHRVSPSLAAARLPHRPARAPCRAAPRSNRSGGGRTRASTRRARRGARSPRVPCARRCTCAPARTFRERPAARGREHDHAGRHRRFENQVPLFRSEVALGGHRASFRRQRRVSRYVGTSQTRRKPEWRRSRGALEEQRQREDEQQDHAEHEIRAGEEHERRPTRSSANDRSSVREPGQPRERTSQLRL